MLFSQHNISKPPAPTTSTIVDWQCWYNKALHMHEEHNRQLVNTVYQATHKHLRTIHLGLVSHPPVATLIILPELFPAGPSQEWWNRNAL
ncbi:hypothetical protein C0995_009996, partial [Termitomyces sp. Mi166